MKTALCRVDEIPAGEVKAVDFFGREVLVLRAEGELRAILNTGMHLGGPMARQGDRLVCAWHGAEFAGADRRCLKGPARPDARLINLPIRIEDGVVTYVYGE